MRTNRLLLAVAIVTLSTTLCAADDYTVRSITLPGGPAEGIGMDYIAFDAATNSVWIPAGVTARVNVIDAKTEKMREIRGFKTSEIVVRERKRTLGPSAVSIGNGVAYIGNRGDSSVCSFDTKTLAKKQCATLSSMPDGVAWVAPTKEVWVTTPRDNSLRILDAATMKEKTSIKLDGGPEGFAVDTKNGRFFTNLEDKDKTLVIDAKTKKTIAAWEPGCGEEGPRGLRADSAHGHLLVACTARVEVLDMNHGGKVLSSLDTGEGVDDFDFAPSTGLVYVGAAKAAKLTIARVDAAGKLTLVASIPTPAGARNPAVTTSGAVYLAHGGGIASSDIAVVMPKKK
jgi:DNA-binding beta-propeller fold protein YncE